MPARRAPGRSRRHAGPAAPRYRIAPGVAHREFEGQLLVLGPRDGELLTLNTTGQLMWRRLARGATAAALARALEREYRIDAARAGRDVEAFLQTLGRRRLVVKE